MPTNEFDELIAKIKEDIQLPNIEITILIGPYFHYAGILAAIDVSYAPAYYIFLDKTFLIELTPEERVAVVAHEAGHILFGPRSNFNRKKETATEMLTDEFAARYVHSKHVQSLLDKVYNDYLTRSENLRILGNTQGR